MLHHTYEDVLQHIIGFLRNRLEGAPEIDKNSHLIKDLNVNSLLVFEIVEELEVTYQIVVPLELLYKERIQTVAELANEVMRLTDKG